LSVCILGIFDIIENCILTFIPHLNLTSGKYQSERETISPSEYSVGACGAIRIAWYIVKYHAYFIAVNVLIDPTSPQYWPSKVVSPGTMWSLAWQIPFVAIEWHMTASSGFIISYLLAICIIHANFLTFWLNILR